MQCYNVTHLPNWNLQLVGVFWKLAKHDEKFT